MAQHRPKHPIPISRSQAIVLVGVVLLLGAAAWGIGWGAHALLNRKATAVPTATTAQPTASPAAATTPTVPAPTSVLSTPTVALPTSTPQPSSTPVPSPTPAPVEEVATVRPGEGLYQVCRRHCPGRWAVHAVPPDLEEYARATAQLNNLPWPDPGLSSGQTLRLPPCPQVR